MKATKFASWAVVTTFFFALLMLGKKLLIPFVIALLVWYVIISLTRTIKRIPFLGQYLPNWLLTTLSTLVIIFLMVMAGELIALNTQEMVDAMPKYETRVRSLYEQLQNSIVGVEIPTASTLFEKIEFTNLISGIVNTFSGFASDAFLILIYVMFLFIEQSIFDKKIKALFPDQEDYGQFHELLDQINDAVISYLSVKSFVSVLTGLLSYFALLLIGIDFAAFWAFLIFILNYIPNIGSVLATLFPAVWALLQFEVYTPFILVLVIVGIIQITIGNILEPKMMGNSLNISPLVVILSLSLWGILWGIAGMVLCVPITVMIMIILAQFPNTKPIAILLSQKGL